MNNSSINSPTDKKHDFAVNLLITALTVLLCFVLLESSIRILAPQYKKISRFHPEVGLTRIPNSTFKFFLLANNIKTTHHTNRDGYSTPNYSTEKTPGTLRIMILGDSLAEALEVPEGDDFSSKVEEKLRAIYEYPVEVINLSYTGYGTAQEYLTFKEFGAKYRPDIIILNFYGENDAVNNMQEFENQKSKPFFDVVNGELEQIAKPQPFQTNIFYTFITDYLVTPRFLFKKWEQMKANRESTQKETEIDEGELERMMAYKKDNTPKWEKAWQITGAILQALKKEVENNSARFIIASMPSARQIVPEIQEEYINIVGAEDLDLRKPDRILQNITDDLKIPFLPLYDTFLSYPDKKELYLQNDWHYTEIAHELAADKIVEFLRTNYLK